MPHEVSWQEITGRVVVDYVPTGRIRHQKGILYYDDPGVEETEPIFKDEIETRYKYNKFNNLEEEFYGILKFSPYNKAEFISLELPVNENEFIKTAFQKNELTVQDRQKYNILLVEQCVCLIGYFLKGYMCPGKILILPKFLKRIIKKYYNIGLPRKLTLGNFAEKIERASKKSANHARHIK